MRFKVLRLNALTEELLEKEVPSDMQIICMSEDYNRRFTYHIICQQIPVVNIRNERTVETHNVIDSDEVEKLLATQEPETRLRK